MKLDILAFGAHPDDVEICCGGTILSHVKQGYKVGIIDLTRGETGTRGNNIIRLRESRAAARILGVAVRENLELPDAAITNDHPSRLRVVQAIRRYRPAVVLANAPSDRHPDHGNAAQLVSDACFLAGLAKLETRDGGKVQKPWRPGVVYHYIQFRSHKPDLVVDITPFMEKKMRAILTHASQFYRKGSKERPTLISSPEFIEFVRARAVTMGMQIGVRYGEGFVAQREIGVRDLVELL